ncbi:hypothetical protein BC834DRAFT_967482 [Gloeopeniophorella convolvens]|nr:hypothetical protein BC834DRAFT_967482 [Gloeopeniophorella convolvens]
MGKSTPKTRAEKALAFLIESGVIYLCIWVAYLVVRCTSLGGLLILNAVIVDIIGIYPAVIVVVVSMRLSIADVLSRLSRSEPLALPTPIVFVSRSLQPESLDNSTSDSPDIASSHGSMSSLARTPILITK